MTTICPDDDPEPIDDELLVGAAEPVAPVEPMELEPAPAASRTRHPVPLTCWPTVEAHRGDGSGDGRRQGGVVQVGLGVRQRGLGRGDRGLVRVEVARGGARDSRRWRAVLSRGQAAPGPRRVAAESAVVSTVASTCPAVTVCPALTLTAFTGARDGEVQIRPDSPARSCPSCVTVCWIVPVVTATVTVVDRQAARGGGPRGQPEGSAIAAGDDDDHGANDRPRRLRQNEVLPAASTFSSSRGSSS